MKYEEFERIYQEYYLKILTFIHKRVPDLYEAEELTGDVFLSFYRNMDSYDEEKGSMEQLSDREQEILLGRFYYQKSSTELGRQMNLSPGNVRMIQKRALEKLRMIMEKQRE